MLRLDSIKYHEYTGESQEWTIDGLRFGQSNLIVGKNATGKSRSLNIINALSGLVSGIRVPGLSSLFEASFSKGHEKTIYKLQIENRNVLAESLHVDGKLLLDRKDGGEGTIFAEDIDNGKVIRFHCPTKEIAVVARLDKIQHSFLADLNSWGTELRHYQFGTPLGKDHFGVHQKMLNKIVNEKDPKEVVSIFNIAVESFSEEFKKMLIDDMLCIDYDIEDIGVEQPISIKIANPPGKLLGLFVQEKGLKCITDQHSMSQGMFRVLSLLIQLNYSLLVRKSSCILIDDIGEGLDFDRSCKLIDLLRKRSKEGNIQIIMSTNDRFVMNRVPIEEWSYLQRNGNELTVLNYDNSQELFEDFKFTGLSNFSFLEIDFPNENSGEENSHNE